MSFDELLADLRKEYVKGFQTKVESLKAAAKTKDLQKIEEIFHQLKGTGKTYGFEEITLLAKPLECVFREQNPRSLSWGESAIELLETWNTHQQQAQPFDLLRDPRYIQLMSQIKIESNCS